MRSHVSDNLNPDFELLSQYREQGDFVEYQGEMYYIGNDPDSLREQGFEFESQPLETQPSLNSRRNVGAYPIPSDPYIEGFNLDQLQDVTFSGTRIKKEGEGVLPDSDSIILNKIKTVPDGYETSKPDHVIYDRASASYYCIRNGCTECVVTPVRVPSHYSVVSADIAAQEPLVSTLVTREPKWVKVFQLRNFRYDATDQILDGEKIKIQPLLAFMDMIAQDYMKVSKDSDEYILFIHNTYTDDRTDLYKLNYLVSICKQDETYVPELEAHILKLIKAFNDFREAYHAKG